MTFEPTYSYDKKKRAAIEPWKCVPLLSIRHLKDKTSLKKCEKNCVGHTTCHTVENLSFYPFFV